MGPSFHPPASHSNARTSRPCLVRSSARVAALYCEDEDRSSSPETPGRSALRAAAARSLTGPSGGGGKGGGMSTAALRMMSRTGDRSSFDLGSFSGRAWQLRACPLLPGPLAWASGLVARMQRFGSFALLPAHAWLLCLPAALQASGAPALMWPWPWRGAAPTFWAAPGGIWWQAR